MIPSPKMSTRTSASDTHVRVHMSIPVESWQLLEEMAEAEHRTPVMQLEKLVMDVLRLTRLEPAPDAPFQQMVEMTGELVDEFMSEADQDARDEQRSTESANIRHQSMTWEMTSPAGDETREEGLPF